ncbi:MAG TPA: sugar transferase, partial [Candidatus Saccharibacteria bacterium]|nr:sugar transferase [Candidatus Saccharibacteria bacterium]
LRVCMLLVDLTAIVTSFGLAYLYRTQYDPRPYLLGSDTSEFIVTIASLLPIWVILLFISGVYDKSIYPYRPKIYWRLFVVSMIGTMSIIGFSFFTETPIFPARLIAVYSTALSFLFLIAGREFVRLVHQIALRNGIGILDTIVVGNNENTRSIVEHFYYSPESGYRVVAVVASAEFVPQVTSELRYDSLEAALANHNADTLIQTDEARTDKVYFEAIDHHLAYMFVPSQKVLLSRMGEMHIMGTQPVIDVRTTPLIGWARAVKRASDIVVGLLLLIITFPIMLVTAAIIKLSEPQARVIYTTKRLSRFAKTVNILKFRTMRSEYNNLSPEEAFAKMGKPGLSATYRANGDQLDNDPRISTFGRFIRRLSIDELPQLFNVIRGDISLVGPRALVPEELKEYRNKNLILSAKSGLTGLAQVSGRRDISFDERRALDTYYIQNWSLSLDIQIILKTIISVLLGRGAH